jgi:curved DNA-binding protein CbpA
VVTPDPFTALGVDEDASDAEVKRRFLALVRAFPPDRDPERFQVYRAAFEALCDQRKRLEATLVKINDAALSRLKLRGLASANPFSASASKVTVCALLLEGAARACAPQEETPRT